MIPVRYFGIEACKTYGFPYIYDELTGLEQAPNYESEPVGMAELEKVLEFVRNDRYYPSFDEKCAYIISSIAGSQYFSNGNKRLSVTVLLMFLLHNNIFVLSDEIRLRALMHGAFPDHTWEAIAGIQKPHSQFLYNLSIVIGDRSKWRTNDFAVIRQRIASMFSVIYQHE